MLLPAVLLIAFALLPGADPRQQAEFFETKVRPVLARNCYACHTASKMSGLELAKIGRAHV